MTTNNQIPLFPPRTIDELVADIDLLTSEIQELYCQDQVPWIIGYSGGKDSSCILQLIWRAIALLPPEKKKKNSSCHHQRYLCGKSHRFPLGEGLYR